MTDIFAQNGITFMSSQMASTAPSANPAPITAPKIDMANAPANASIPQVNASDLAPSKATQTGGSVPPPPAPDQIAANLAGNGNPGVSAAAGAAPPQPPAQPGQGKDIFENEGITPTNSAAPANPLARGVTFGNGQPAPSPEAQPVVDYANQVNAQTQSLAALRFTPQQIKAYVNDPTALSEAIQNQDQFPDAPKLIQQYQSGAPMTEAQNNRLSDYVDTTLKAALRGVSWDGNKALVDPKLPASLIQYIQSASAGNLPPSDGAQGVPYVNGANIVPPPYSPKPGERPINDYAAVTDKGQQMMQQAQTAPASTALKTVPYDQLPADVKSALYDSMVLHDPNAKITDLMHQQGYSQAVDALGEQKVADIIHWYSPMSFAEHQNAQYQGEMFPLSQDEQGNWRFDPRAGIISPLMVPGDIAAGNIEHKDIEGEGRNMAANIAMMKFGNEAGARMDTTRASKSPEATQAPINTPAPTVDDYMGALTPSKDQALVNSGVVSVDGAKSNATMAAEQILTQKGLLPDQAQETVANMTAREKDSFVATNTLQPRSSVPNLADTVEAADIPAHVKAQLLPDEPPPSGDPGADIARGQTAAVNNANPTPILDEQSGFNQMFENFKAKVWKPFYAEMFNDVQLIEDLSGKARAAGADVPIGEDSKLLVSFAKSTPAWIERNWTTNTTEFDKSGNQVITGKGLKVIRDEFDTVLQKTEPDWKARQDDMNAYRSARTFIEDKEKNLSNVSDKDMTQSVADLQRLAQKYGDNFKYFETFGKQEVQWNNRILHNLVSSGLKTQEWYDSTVGQREWYSPTQRVVEEEYPEMISGKKIGEDPNPSLIGALKQRFGSSRELKDPFQSQLRNAAIILKKAADNNLTRNIAKFKEYYPDDVKVVDRRVIRDAVEHSYDPKLRTKLEQLVDFLGGEVKRVEKVEGGTKRTLGAYDPNSKEIFVRPGTTEGTLTHEAGHMLDYILGLKDRMLRSNEHPEIKAELQKLAEDRLRSEISLQKTPEGMTEFAEKLERAPKSFEKYLKNDDEILANFFDTWVNAPERLAKEAPQAKAEFERLIDENPQLAMLRDVRPSTARATEVLQRELLDHNGPKGSIPFYENGTRKFLVVNKGLQKAFTSMTPMEIGSVERFLNGILSASTKTLKFGATSLPDFMIKHFSRAVVTSFLNNPAEKGLLGFARHGGNLARGIFSVIKKDELYHQWASSSGALRTFMKLDDKALTKVQEEMFLKNNAGAFLNPLNWLKLAGKGYMTTKEISDYAPRIAVYKSMKKAGYSDLEAGLASLEATGNYIRHGDFVKRLNQKAPFLNDMVQGGDRFVRSQMRDWKGFTLKALAVISQTQLAITGYYLYAADDQTRKEYLNIEDFERSGNMCVKIGDTWHKIPRAFAPGFIYGALLEKSVLYAYSKSHAEAPEIKNWWLKTIQEAATSVSPVFDWTRAINPLFKSWMENTMNYSLFMQRPLYTGDMEKTMPMDQQNQYTTETAKEIGKILNISPIDIDNTVYDMSAKMGKFAEHLSDMAINSVRKAQGEPVNERETRPSDSPLYGGLVMDTPRGTNTESYQEFLSHLHEATQAHDHDKELTNSDMSDYENKNNQILSAYSQINAANNQVNALQKQIRQINNDVNVPAHDKTVRIQGLQDQIGEIVHGANQGYRNATEKKQ